MGIFFGTYSRTLDEKNRLQIPSKLIGELPHSFYVLKGFEGCLSVYLENDFTKLVEELKKLSYLEEKSRAYLRLTVSSVNELEVDPHGRLLLSKDLVEAYKIGKNVTIIGALDHFEIWDSEKYASYLSSHEGDYEALAEVVGKERQ